LATASEGASSYRDDEGRQAFPGSLRYDKLIFRCLSEGLTRMNNQLQIVVIEHADEIAWEGFNNVYLVERWLGDKFLIHLDWEE
jgi:hypothetical protein